MKRRTLLRGGITNGYKELVTMKYEELDIELEGAGDEKAIDKTRLIWTR